MRARAGAIGLVVLVALFAIALARAIPLVGAPVFAILGGAALAAIVQRAPSGRRVVALAGKYGLQAAIVLLGLNLDLWHAVADGARVVPLMLVTFAVVVLLGYVFGRALRLDASLRRLISVGTAICGASAIAAVCAVVDTPEADVAYSVSVVFFYNLLAVVIFPPLGHLLALSQHAFGTWAGTAINDTSSVVAAGYAYGPAAGADAVVTKLTRTTLIIPIVLLYALKRLRQSRTRSSQRVPWRSVVPWFVLWFVLAAALNSTGVVPVTVRQSLAQIALVLIVVALGAVGLQTDFARVRAAGVRPLLLGGALWIAIACSSFALLRFGATP